MQAREHNSSYEVRNMVYAVGSGKYNTRDGDSVHPASTAQYPWEEKYEDRYPAAPSSVFEKRYPRDRFGDEPVDNDRVWRVYRDRATELDDELFNGWRESLDVFLIFAGLFAAVCAAFIIEAQKQLRPDWTEVTARATYALWAQSASSSNATVTTEAPQNPASFKPDRYIIWTNWLWFISLALCVACALVAILAKQWIGEYKSRMRAGATSHRWWAWRHRALSQGLHRFRLNLFIAALPVILHLALLAFLAGLCLFLVPLDGNLALTLGIAAVVLATSYVLVAVILPIHFPELPPVIPLFEQVQYTIMSASQSIVQWLQRRRLYRPSSASEPVSCASKFRMFQEERILRRTKSQCQRDRDVLLWMIKHLPDTNDVSVALEAIGLLPLSEYRNEFSPKDIHDLREIVIIRNRDLTQSGHANVSDADRVGLLRTCAFLVAIGDEADRTLVTSLDVVTGCHLIRTYDAPLLYQTIFRDERSMLAVLDALKHWFATRGAIEAELPATHVSLALWTASAAECLLTDAHTRRGPSIDSLDLGRLATLLQCVIAVSSAADAHEKIGSSRCIDSNRDRANRAVARTRQEAGYARVITLHAARLRLPHSHEETGAFAGAEKEVFTSSSPSQPWILESLSTWGCILGDHAAEQDQQCDFQTLHSLYATLLAHVSDRTVPISSNSNLHRCLYALNYVTTPDFSRMSWTAVSLMGPLDLLMRFVQHISSWDDGVAEARLWIDATTLLAHLFAYVAGHRELARNDPLSRIITSIIDILGKQRVGRRPFSIRSALSGQLVGEGHLALLHAPADGRLPSVWNSACQLRSIAGRRYSRILLEVATRIGLHLSKAARQSESQRRRAEEIMRDVLAPDETLTMLREDDGQMLNLHLRQISPELREEAGYRLAALDEAQSRRLRHHEDTADTTIFAPDEMRLVNGAVEAGRAPHWNGVSAPTGSAVNVRFATPVDGSDSE